MISHFRAFGLSPEDAGGALLRKMAHTIAIIKGTPQKISGL